MSAKADCSMPADISSSLNETNKMASSYLTANDASHVCEEVSARGIKVDTIDAGMDFKFKKGDVAEAIRQNKCHKL